jgi:gamma-glutamyltranspeptidase/glutathione hydrolase
MRIVRAISLFGTVLLAARFLTASASPIHGYAATVNPLATSAATQAMRDGGNAVDGAIAAALTLAVVDPHNSGIGGGLFMLIRRPDGEFVAIDGRETAPHASTPELYFRNGKPDAGLLQQGPLAAGVPGEVAALHVAARSARLPLKLHLERAAALAERGFQPDSVLQGRLASHADRLQQFPATAEIFQRPTGSGNLLQPDLGRSLRSIAIEGPSWFYKGGFARATEDWMRKNGGVMDARDFANYEAKMRSPLKTTYRGFGIVGFPPPSSGGVHVAEILNILEAFDIRAMGDGTADFYHVVAEAMKLAFADRAHWLGDPKFTAVPRGLIEGVRAGTRAKDQSSSRYAGALAWHAGATQRGIVRAAHHSFLDRRFGRLVGGMHCHDQQYLRIAGRDPGHGRVA